MNLADLKPLATGSAAVFNYDEALHKRFILAPVYEDDTPISLAKVVLAGNSKKLWLPRGAFQIGDYDARVKGSAINVTSSFVARSAEQERVVAESAALLNAGHSFVTQAPTGFGKTVLAAAVIAAVKRTTLVIVNKEDIRDQWVDAFDKVLNLKPHQIGFVQADTCSAQGKPVSIALIQSVAKPQRYPPWLYPYFGLVIWDEVHRVGAEFFSETAWMFPGLLRWGLSAKPQRKDGRDSVIWAHIGKVRVKTEANNMGFRVLVKRSGWKVPRNQYGEQVPHSPGRTMHINKMLANSARRNHLIGAFVRKAYDKGRHTIVFADTRDHLETLKNLIWGHYKVPAHDLGFYVGGLSKAQRELAKTKKVIFATYQMASEATDIPRLDTAVLGTPRSDVLQIVGRILRIHEDKRPPVVMDVLDDDSSVFKGYFRGRFKFYRSKGAEVQYY